MQGQAVLPGVISLNVQVSAPCEASLQKLHVNCMRAQLLTKIICLSHEEQLPVALLHHQSSC